MKQRRPVLLALLFLLLLVTACADPGKQAASGNAVESKQIAAMLDSFNVAAAKADFNTYFGFYTEDAIFTGTDATERWNKKQFMEWARPIFARGRAWNFKALQRNIYFDETGKLAWFDELLNTQMKICRGSGVLVKEGGAWRVKQYILSTMVPNDLLDTVIKLKTPQEDSIIRALEKK